MARVTRRVRTTLTHLLGVLARANRAIADGPIDRGP